MNWLQLLTNQLLETSGNWLSAHWGTIIIFVAVPMVLTWLLGPWHWGQVPLKWAGVIFRFERVTGGVHEPGPVFVGPFARLVRIPMYVVIETLPNDASPLPMLMTCATTTEPAQEVTLEVIYGLQFERPVLVVQSRPDSDPVQEFDRFVGAAIGEAISQMTASATQSSNARHTIQTFVMEKIAANELFQEWGLKLRQFEVRDIDLSGDYKLAATRRVMADADFYATTRAAQAIADSLVINATSEAEATQIQIAKQGLQTFLKLERMQTIERALKGLQPGVTFAGDIMGMIFGQGGNNKKRM